MTDKDELKRLRATVRRLRRGLRMAEQELERCQPTTAPSTSMEARRAEVVEVAFAEWRKPVIEPQALQRGDKNAEHIDTYIRGPYGLGWPSVSMTEPNVPYRKDGDFAWCGAFAAFAWGVLAKPLNATLRRDRLASTYRLDKWCREEPRRRVPVEDIESGEVVVMGPKGHRYGTHIGIAVEWKVGLLHTIEGNARGQGPEGREFEGVVRQVRRRDGDYHIHYGVRFFPEDCR